MINCESDFNSPNNEQLKSTIQAVSRMNFYLWMYLAQEEMFDDAFAFVKEKQHVPSPFESMLGINPQNANCRCDPMLYDF